MNSEIKFKPIGVIRSCFTDKFGTPRQPGLVESASAVFELLPPYNQPDALRGLDAFSHVWIVFVFHQSVQTEWKATVRPPRLGGNERIGVFASRSNFRPNPIGLSVVELQAVNGTSLKLGGGDLLDGTPVLDIKPYVPYADSLPHAQGAFAHGAPERINSVAFSADIEQRLEQLGTDERPALRQLIVDMLSFDPRPAYRPDEPDRIYGTKVFDLDVKWMHSGNRIEVIQVGK